MEEARDRNFSGLFSPHIKEGVMSPSLILSRFA